MRHLASIQLIEEVQPIEGADRIEAVRVKEWWCVSSKGEFVVDQSVVYFEVDSLMPSSNPAFAFLGKGTKERSVWIEGKEYKGYRLKTIKLKGQVSQGLCMPLSILDGCRYTDDTRESPKYNYPVGKDVSELLSVVKYEIPLPACIAGTVKGLFPGFIPKTDEERVQNLKEVVEQNQGEVFYVTEKLDGCSATYYKKDGEYGVCSRNLELLKTEGNTLWEMSDKYKIEEILLDNYAIQGELIGCGIQNNPLKRNEHDLYIYNVYSIKSSKYLDYSDVVRFCKDTHLKMVPLLDDKFVLDKTVEELLEYAEGKSVVSPDLEREGVVLRPLTERTAVIQRTLTRLSFKCVSNKYLLTVEE